MPNKKYLIVVGGPTASGKTSLAIQLAQHFQTEILSADSRQFYRELNIGTAKPATSELNAAPHHFINHLSIKAPYDVGQFEAEALALLEKLFQQHDQLILVGGSGLYIKAICEGLDRFPEVPENVRQEIENLYQTQGLAILQKELQKVDPVYYAEVDLQNPHRLIRALAVCHASGQTFSSFRQQKSEERSFIPVYLQIQWPRDLLYQRIDLRVDQMIEAGLVEEARELLPYQGHSALQTVGYQELFPYLTGATTLEEAIALIKRNSRRYAKRQLTWNRRDGFWKHLLPGELEIALRYINQVQKEGFLVQTQTDTSNDTKWLCGLKNGQEHLKILREEIKRTVCFSKFEQITTESDSTALRLFAHETSLQPEDQDAYLIIPLTIEPFFLEFGFHHISLADLPPKIQQRWSAISGEPNQTVLYKPARIAS